LLNPRRTISVSSLRATSARGESILMNASMVPRRALATPCMHQHTRTQVQVVSTLGAYGGELLFYQCDDAAFASRASTSGALRYHLTHCQALRRRHVIPNPKSLRRVQAIEWIRASVRQTSSRMWMSLASADAPITVTVSVRIISQ
jgi:hypothetical protein